MAYCSLCDNTGWMPILVDGVRRMARCTHLAAERAEREKQRPGGSVLKQVPGVRCQVSGSEPLTPSPETRLSAILRQRPELEAVLTRNDVLVGKLIENRVGKANALPIRELLPLLGEGWTDRDVKAAVEHLRDFARLPIVASKVPPYGYFIPATAQECDDAFERYCNEGIKLFRIAKLVKPGADLSKRLHGQLELTTESTENAEARG